MVGSRFFLIVFYNFVDLVKVFVDFCIDIRFFGDGIWVLILGDDVLKRFVVD